MVFSASARLPPNVFALGNLLTTWVQERKETTLSVLTPQWRCCQDQDQGPGFHPPPRTEDAGGGESCAGFLGVGFAQLTPNEGVWPGHLGLILW